MTGSNILREAGFAAASLLVLCSSLTAAGANSNAIEFPQYIRDAWDASRGYPGGSIYGITQTSDGYLWIGTDRGLIRFDGSVFRVFRQTDSAHSLIDSVFSLAGDSQGNLLISSHGLRRLRLRNDALEELPPLPGQPRETLSVIYQEHSGLMLARVRRGMVAYDGKGFTPLQGLFPQMTAAVQARDGAVWMGTASQGLFVNRDPRTVKGLENLSHFKITALVPFGEHGLRVGTEEGLLQWDGTNAPGRLFGPPHIRAMLEDRQGNLWLASTDGLYRIASVGGEPSSLLNLPGGVTSLYEDREGDIWVGTSTGIVRLRQRVLTTYDFEPAAGRSAGPLLAGGQGTVWWSRRNLGLMQIAGGKIKSILATGDYTALAGDGPDLLLGQNDGALLRVKGTNSAAGAAARKEAQVGQPITSLFKSGEGTIWVGTQNAGVAEVANGRTTVYSSADKLVLTTVTSIEESRDGTMWFATESGVASLSRGRWQSYTARDGLPPGRINCLLADGSGVLWAGADQGLAYIEKGNVHTTASKPPLLHEPIFGIAEDRDDFLWILTSSHVFRVKRAELLNSGAGSILVRQFGVDDGLPTVSPSRTRSMATDTGGRVWISLGNQLVMADPAQLRQPSPPTLIQFQQVSADDLSLRLGDTVSVPARHVRTIIRFTGLNLAAPDRVRFRYKLNGFEDHWSQATPTREASYTTLPPGPYRFEVQASNIDGLWNGPSAGIELYVEPAVWQTLWFRASGACAIFAIGFLAYHLRLRAVKRQWNLRFQERLDERTRIARDLHDTLLQSFHGLILRFQAVRDMLPEEPEAAGEALGSVIDRAAAAVTEGRDAVQALRGEEELDNLGESLAMIDREFRSEAQGSEQLELETRYRVLVEGTPRRLHPVVRDDVYRIALEAVRNAFRHAHARQVELDIRYDDGAFRIRVRDDGGGIDPQVLSSGRRKGHYGLPGMRERATSIGGQFEIWSELGRGTEIEVTIPGMIVYGRIEDAETARLYLQKRER